MLQLKVSRMFQRTEKSRWSSGTALSMMGVKGLWARGGGGGQGGGPVLKQWRPKDGVGLVVATMGIGDLSA